MRRRETTPVKKSLKALAMVLGAVVLAMVVFLLDLLRFSGTCAAVAIAGSSETSSWTRSAVLPIYRSSIGPAWPGISRSMAR
jgi:hypothetical protein